MSLAVSFWRSTYLVIRISYFVMLFFGSKKSLFKFHFSVLLAVVLTPKGLITIILLHGLLRNRYRFLFNLMYGSVGVLFFVCYLFILLMCLAICICSAKATECPLFINTVNISFSHLKLTVYLFGYGATKH